MFKFIIKPLILAVIGGALYTFVEIVWRGHSHVSMFILGGLCFMLIGAINELFPWEMGLIWQMLLGAVIVTSLELVVGIIVNIRLGLEVWDYSNLPYNFMGQIALRYSLMWIALSGVAIVIDDYLRYRLFGEKKPKYRLI